MRRISVWSPWGSIGANTVAGQQADAAVEAAKPVTFEQLGERYILAHEAEWTNAEHRRQWRTTLRDYVYPHIGASPPQAIDTSLAVRDGNDVLARTAPDSITDAPQMRSDMGRRQGAEALQRRESIQGNVATFAAGESEGAQTRALSPPRWSLARGVSAPCQHAAERPAIAD